MKRICITYHMHREGETTETCVTLAMEDQIADILLLKQEDATALLGPGMVVSTALRCLSAIQGYEFSGFRMAEEARPMPYD